MKTTVRSGSAVVLLMLLAACGSSGPTSPTGTTPPPAPPRVDFPLPSGELWRLTTAIVSLEGSACFWPHPVGKTFDWTLSVERNGGQVRFVYDVYNPHDNLSFVGAVQEQSFTAVTDTYRSFWQCVGGQTISSSVVGSFSSDGHTLSGRERLIYRGDGGKELIITLEWNAARI
jgi:hypothetical protein